MVPAARQTHQDPFATFAPGLFAGRVVLVTGGGTGIGREVALGFAGLGADVVIASRDPAHLEQTATDIEALGRQCLAHPVNIRDTDAVDALRDATYDRFGKLDYLINNAGGQFPAKPSDISDNGWRAVIDLNLNGTWNMISRFMEPMAEAGYGSIVNIIHVYSFDRGSPPFAHSGAARAGVANLTRSMAPFLGLHGVTINSLAPGTIGTEGMHEGEGIPLGLDPEAMHETAGELGILGRLGRADETASVVAFLCSPAARFITGTALVADGGEMLANWIDWFPRGEL